MSIFKASAPQGLTMLEAMLLDPTGTTYTFVDNEHQEATHIASKVLWDVVHGRMTVSLGLFDPTLVEAIERGLLGVEEEHALKLPDEALDVPLLVCQWGDGHVIADGNHRLWRRYKRGDTSFPMYYVPEPVWREFVIYDIPGDSSFWDDFNRNAKVRTPEMEAMARDPEVQRLMRVILGVREYGSKPR